MMWSESCAEKFDPVSRPCSGIPRPARSMSVASKVPTAVVHLAGAGIGDRRWSDSRKRVLVESRTRSTAVLAGALAGLDRRPEVLVNGSAIGIYGDRGDEILTERSPHGDDFLASLCVQWEAETAPAAEAGVRVVCARTGVVLSGQGGALPKLLPLFKVGLGGRLGSGAQWWSWIALDDEIRAIEWLLEHDVRGPVNLTAPAPVTNREFTAVLSERAVATRLGCPCPSSARGCCSEPSSPTRCCSRVPAVRPEVLESGGFAFAHGGLAEALRTALEPPPP